MFRLFGAVVAMAIPLAQANGGEHVRRASDEPIEVCEALPNDMPIEQSLVTDPTMRQASQPIAWHRMHRETPR